MSSYGCAYAGAEADAEHLVNGWTVGGNVAALEAGDALSDGASCLRRQADRSRNGTEADVQD